MKTIFIRDKNGTILPVEESTFMSLRNRIEYQEGNIVIGWDSQFYEAGDPRARKPIAFYGDENHG